MLRNASLFTFVLLVVGMLVPAAVAEQISGDYLEIRTCNVYTGPCFANAEVGLTGRQAVMAWSVDEGDFDGVRLDGLKVVVAIRASDTLAFGGGVVFHPDPIKSVILVDESGTEEQQRALAVFARRHAGRVLGEVVRVDAAPIEMSLDHINVVGRLKASRNAEILTRKLEQGDCVCTNEEIFYPPLADVENLTPAYTLRGSFTGRGLATQWSYPESRSAFLATFAYSAE